MKAKMGAPLKYDQEKHLKLFLDAIAKVLVMGQVANLAGVPRTTLKSWLDIGDRERLAGSSSEIAQFSSQYRKAQADQVVLLISDVRSRKKNWQAAQWLLERCFREDFGQDALFIQELNERLSLIENKLNLDLDSPFKDAVGKEINQPGKPL